MAVALAAPHARAVEAGQDAVRAGGNALDAALAAAAMLTVVYPHQCAIGGDVVALVRAPDGSARAVIGAGTAPRDIARVSAAWTGVPRFGVHSVTVPGMFAGWQALSALGARLPLSAALLDAAAVAEEGARVSAGLARALVSRSDAVMNDPGMRAVFAPSGAALTEGELLVQPALAETLRRLAADPDDFARGRTARSIVRTLRAQGGAHTLDDFADYRAETVDALSVAVGAQTWTVAPPPSAGAILLGVALAEDAGTPTGLVDAVVRGVASRAAHLGDPRAGAIDVDAMLALRAGDDPLPSDPRPTGDTAAVVAIDDEGWAVTIVQSVFFTFGSGVLDPATGVLLHNRGSAFVLDEGSPARLRPGARPPHTLTPALVEAAGTTLVAGCQGGRAQPWILAQLLPDAVVADALDAVLARPRWVVGAHDLGRTELTLVHEPGVDAAILAHVDSTAMPRAAWDGPADEAGHVQLVRRRPDGTLDAASDPRADGRGVVVEGSTHRPHAQEDR